MAMTAARPQGAVIFHKGAKRAAKTSKRVVWGPPPGAPQFKPDQGLTRRGIRAAVRRVFAEMPEKERAEIIAIYRGEK